MMARRKTASSATSGASAGLLALVVLVGFVLVVMRNTSEPAPLAVELPTQALPTVNPNPISALFREGFGENSTALPTVAIPNVQPTIAQIILPLDLTPTLVSAADLDTVSVVVPNLASTPTLPPATLSRLSAASATADGAATPLSVTRAVGEWQPPPLIPPLSRDPLGRDHYWFLRPIDSNARNWVLSIYPYGSDGNDRTNILRVHHGIDMPNPVGELVRAAGSGVVIWAADGRQENVDIFQNSPSYGNVILIEHDFGYQGRPLWTLYAHLSAALVERGQVVAAGEPIGLVGNTGRVTGPHVHFEVRMGENRYASTYNPVLWMVPYVGHGVIAGRVVDVNGRFIDDVDITIRNWATGLVETTTSSYVFLQSGSDVNPDPIWRENFAVADVPVGRYEVIATIDGQRLVSQVVVVEGTTTFVELKPSLPEPGLPSDNNPSQDSFGGG
ncbi:MAG: peptidoglycan DD-metalloendopeptidase family protein [Anaerolineae bacterium]|nr:peptidoglycan DD-metalloendopeptidase family protein [Anaerolineae bacterium]MDW8170973.1 peptidoglycan DD-metalloendopeptidase family protein [Anaerolineae bacterium]